ncbi:MAG: FAD:protein FMN transferase, partial [Candidatus Binatia bacterium]
SISTSRANGAGAEAGPIVDPRTRRPVEPPRMATVIAPDATAAEVWSTALVVLGAAGLERAAANGVEALVADRSGVHRTAGFRLD